MRLTTLDQLTAPGVDPGISRGQQTLAVMSEIGPLFYERSTYGGCLRLADGSKWVPLGTGTDIHWQVRKDGSDQTALIARMFRWHANGVPLALTPGLYGYRNGEAKVARARFDITCPRGGVVFRQVPGRNADRPGWQTGGEDVAETTLAVGAGIGETKVTLVDASGAREDDLIYLTSNRLREGDHRFDERRSYGQLCKIRSISGNVVHLYDPLDIELPVGLIASGRLQSGFSGGARLPSAEQARPAEIRNYPIRITSGAGAGQSKYVHEYNFSNRTIGLGTSFGSFPQEDWSQVPNGNSGYEIRAEVTATIIGPARGRIEGIRFEGLPENGVSVRGVQLARWDEADIDRMAFHGSSRHGLYAILQYRSMVRRSTAHGANYAFSNGGGLGYGFLDIGSYGLKVEDCHATNCRTGFDQSGRSLHTVFSRCSAAGGGKTYEGKDFFPAPNGVPNSGFSTHNGSAHTLVDRCSTRNLYLAGKGRSESIIYDGCQHFGQGAPDRGLWQISYAPQARLNNCSYEGLVSDLQPPQQVQRPGWLAEVRETTMPANSHVFATGCKAIGVRNGVMNVRERDPAKTVKIVEANNSQQLAA